MTLRDFQQDFNKNFGNKLNKRLSKRFNELTELLSDQSQKTLSYALEFIRPFNLSLGLRFAKLSQKHVEVVIPARAKNCDDQGVILEAIVIAAAIEGGRLLWKHNWPTGGLKISSSEVNFKSLKSSSGDLCVRAELTDVQRESVFADLQAASKGDTQLGFLVYDEHEQISCEVTVTYKLSVMEQLGYK